MPGDLPTTYSRLLQALRHLRSDEHLCPIYQSPEEQLTQMLAFVQAGVERGERCLCITDAKTTDAVFDAARQCGIDLDGARERGALVIAAAEGVQPAGEPFDPEKRFRFLAEALREAEKDGYRGLRWIGDVARDLGRNPGKRKLVDYEGRLDGFLREHRACALCLYDRKNLPPETILAAMRTHPVLICLGHVCRNPYYIPPEPLRNPCSAEREVERHLEYILERERTTAELSYQAMLLENISDVVLAFDPRFILTSWNRAAERIYGWKTDEVLGRPVAEILRPAYIGLSREEALRSLLSLGHLEAEAFVKRKDGRALRMEMKTMALRDETGEVTGYVCIHRDVTEQRRAEEALRESDRMKTEFVSTTAHEFRTPLTSIQGYSELLLTREDLSAQERRDLLSCIHESAVDLSRIVADLLDIARIEAGHGLSLELSPCSMGEVFAKVVSSLARKSAGHRLEVTLEGEDDLLLMDKGKMGQVLENLISNALKYSPEGSLVQIRGGGMEGGYRVVVEDEGIGMTPEELEKIFDKFFRADSSRAAAGGVGLGMSIVKHIVEGHGGKVEVQSQPGKGTKVVLVLPAGS